MTDNRQYNQEPTMGTALRIMLGAGLYILALLTSPALMDSNAIPYAWVLVCIALGVGFLTAWVAAGSRRSFSILRALSASIIVWIGILSIQELSSFPDTIKWRALYWIWNFSVLLFFLAIEFLQQTSGMMRRFITLRKTIQHRLGRLHYGLGLLAMLFPVWFCIFTNFGEFSGEGYSRIYLLIIFTLISAVVATRDDIYLLRWNSTILTALLIAFFFASGKIFRSVVDYPFSLSWSEGNRFYDYSLIFGRSLYQYSGDLEVNYFSPGRYGLWGLPFLIPSFPIWVHRLWNALLWTLTPLGIGLLTARRLPLSDTWRISVGLGFTLLMMQAPIYPHLLVPMLLPALFDRSPLRWRIVLAAAASFYAGISRFTWAILPAAWFVLVELAVYYPLHKGSWWKRILPAITLALAGSLPGILMSWGMILFSPESAFGFAQPLLWYRLFPNSTFPSGILLGLAYSAVPALVLVVWLGLQLRQKSNALFMFIAVLGLLGTLIAGLVASVKIGGGSNLHNLDMFFLLLILTVALMLERIRPTPMYYSPRPVVPLAAGMIGLGYFLIVSVTGSSPLPLPDPGSTQKTIQRIQNAVELASGKGEILFMDQRQLLTFGVIQNLPLVPEYEKKFLMDQAMAENGNYFNAFYADLENKRFQLIVSDILYTNKKGKLESFGEENDAWVKWVAKPLLQYYTPIDTFREFGIQLLVPK